MRRGRRAPRAPQHRLGHLVRRVGGAASPSTSKFTTFKSKIVHNPDCHIVVIRRAGAKELGRGTSELGDQPLIDRHLVDHLGDTAGSSNAVDRSTSHRQWPVLGAVVGDLEQGVGSQLPERAGICLDPARIDDSVAGTRLRRSVLIRAAS